MKKWTVIIGTAIAGSIAGLAAPFVAEFVRSARKEGTKAAKRTKTKVDDAFWNLFGPSLDRVADIIDDDNLSDEQADEAVKKELERIACEAHDAKVKRRARKQTAKQPPQTKDGAK